MLETAQISAPTITRQRERRLPANLGSPAMIATPPKASAMPRPRRQPRVSPKKIAANREAKGTCNWMAMAAVETSIPVMPVNIKMK